MTGKSGTRGDYSAAVERRPGSGFAVARREERAPHCALTNAIMARLLKPGNGLSKKLKAEYKLKLLGTPNGCAKRKF